MINLLLNKLKKLKIVKLFTPEKRPLLHYTQLKNSHNEFFNSSNSFNSLVVVVVVKKE